MFKLLKRIQNIGTRTSDLAERVQNADKVQKRQLKHLVIFSTSLFVLILLTQVVGIIHNSNKPEQSIETVTVSSANIPVVFDKYNMDVPELDVEKVKEERSIGIFGIDPLGSILDPIVEAINKLVQEVLNLFDNFVGSTPNIGRNDGEIYGFGSEVPIQIDKFYNLTNALAWLLLPLFIVMNGAAIIMEGSFKGRELLMQLGKKVLIFVIAMAATRYILVQAIDLMNAINKLIIQDLISGNSSLLSQAVLSAMGVQSDGSKLSFPDSGGFNPFAQAIIWGTLLCFLVLLLFQFIVRFFHLLLHMILYPVIYVIGLMPGGGQFLRTWIEEIVRTLIVQPIFLLGFAVVIEIIKGGNGSVAKIVLGLGAVSFLNTVPIIVNRISGFLWTMGGGIAAGMFAMGTVGQASLLKKGIVAGATGEKSGSLRMFGAKGIGRAITGQNPLQGLGGNGKGIIEQGKNFADKGGVFKTAMKNGEKTSGAFGKLGMTPLDANSLKPDSPTKSLFTNTPNFGDISKVSVKDSNRLSSAFTASNLGGSFGFPMTEQQSNINSVANLSGFTPSNTQTNSLLDSSISHKQMNVSMGKTFDTSNQAHWGHLTNWYAKNESMSSGKSVQSYQKFINNPQSRNEILQKGQSEGYFRSQGINTLKVTDKTQNGEPINKYYQLNKPQVKSNQNARSSSAKVK